MEQTTHPKDVAEPAEVDRLDIPRGWYDLVVLGRGWEAIGAAWHAASLGARTAIVPGDTETESARLTVPRPLCQWWKETLPGQQADLVGHANRAVSWHPPEGPFVEGLPRGGVGSAAIAVDKALGQLAASGVAVFRGPACFRAPDVLEVRGHPIPFRKVLLAVGEYVEPVQLPGVEPADLTTPDQLWNHGRASSAVPQDSSKSDRGHLRAAIVGDGPIECFWAQWLARQGCQVHLVFPGSVVAPNEAPEISQWLQNLLVKEGVRLHSRAVCQEVQRVGEAKLLLLERPDQQEKLLVDRLAVVPQMRLDLSGWQLERAGLQWTDRGVLVDAWRRTRNRRILAAGAVCGPEFRCARIAWAMVEWAVESALGRRPPPRNWLLARRCIPTDPPIVRLGQSVAEAERDFWQVQTYRVQFSPDVESANQSKSGGFLAIHVRSRSGRIVGATLAGPWAHELADLVAFLMQQKIPLAQWAIPTGGGSTAMYLLEEAARMAEEDHRPRWWDASVETLRRIWRQWRGRSDAEIDKRPLETLPLEK